jgi:hypothetical protein
MTVNHFTAAGERTSREWTSTLPDGELATCVALGDDFVVLGTDKNYVRVYSINGLQHAIDYVPGTFRIDFSTHQRIRNF